MVTTTDKPATVQPTTAQLAELVGEHQRIANIREGAWEEFKSLSLAAKAAVLGTQYESLEAYQAAALALEQSQNLGHCAKARYEALTAAQNRIDQDIRKLIPQCVWIRVGEVGVGVAHTNWGGSQYYVVVEPWQAEMASLHRDHRGD